MKRVNFNLKNVDGENHTFEVELFSVRENANLQLICAGPLIKAVGRLAAVIAPAFKSAKDDAKSADLNIGEVLSGIDWQNAPDALLAIPEMIVAEGGPDLITRIFARTVLLTEVPELAGQPTVSNETIDPHIRQELKDSSVQDAIFGDGNMAEYWQAAASVLLVNFSRYGRNGSMNWRALVEKLTLGALQPSPTSSATGQPSNATPTAATSPSG